ncbi:hypothetical protein D3C75_1187680 [compost metagenome]
MEAFGENLIDHGRCRPLRQMMHLGRSDDGTVENIGMFALHGSAVFPVPHPFALAVLQQKAVPDAAGRRWNDPFIIIVKSGR